MEHFSNNLWILGLETFTNSDSSLWVNILPSIGILMSLMIKRAHWNINVIKKEKAKPFKISVWKCESGTRVLLWGYRWSEMKGLLCVYVCVQSYFSRIETVVLQKVKRFDCSHDQVSWSLPASGSEGRAYQVLMDILREAISRPDHWAPRLDSGSPCFRCLFSLW